MDGINTFAWLILDTNSFLHFNLDQVSWCSLVNAREIALVVPMTVIDELDKHKNSQNKQIRTRASRAIKKLKELTEADNKLWSSKITTCIGNDVSSSVVIEMGLDPTRADDKIIASTKLIAESKTAENVRVIIISNDLGMKLKASFRGIHVLPLPEKYQIPPELDNRERELVELRKLNTSLLNRMPKLQVNFGDSEQRLVAQLTPYIFLTQSEIDERVAEVMKINPLYEEKPMIDGEGVGDLKTKSGMKVQDIVELVHRMQQGVLPSRAQWEEYNSNLESFVTRAYYTG